MEGQQKPHFLLIAFPAQGHINPALQFAKRLLRAGDGAHVTLVTTISGLSLIDKAREPDALQFAPFSDGNGDEFRRSDGDVAAYMSTLKQNGSDSLRETIEKSRMEGKQVTCLVYTLLLPWASQVAREYHVPSALLWIQPATVFDIYYYYYFRGYRDVIHECENNPEWSIELPNLPFTFKTRELPSFLLPSTPCLYNAILSTLLEQIEELEKEETSTILVNTFGELERDALKAIERFTLIPIGPLIPTAFFVGRDPSGRDHFHKSKSEGYMKWLDSQDESSVIYVSFGSISVLSGPQQEELARALIQIRRPFLWVIREKENENKDEKLNDVEDNSELSCIEELKQLGMIVPWCSQVQVLSHPSVGCFVTHCGWNSTLESLTSGVPMVAFPQWTDQTTNAKLVEEVWKTGVRVNKSEEEEGSLVKDKEVKRCLELVMESEEMKGNAMKWKELAIQASKEDGCSDMNLKHFINKITSH